METTAIARSMRGSIGSGPAGERNAEFFDRPTPYPDISALGDPRNGIETATDRSTPPMAIQSRPGQERDILWRRVEEHRANRQRGRDQPSG